MAITGAADTMSDVLSLMHMRSETVAARDYVAPFGVSFGEAHAHIHFVQSGSACVVADGRLPVRLSAGDLLVLPRGCAHALSDAPGRAATSPAEASGGLRTSVISASLLWQGAPPPRLLESLPTFIHVEACEDGAWTQALSGVLAEELEARALGWSLLVSRLLGLLFLRAVSEWARSNPSRIGVLRASADPAIARAVSAVHDDSAGDWDVENLAAVAGLSRSAFHARFAAAVGETPARYIARRRLEIAAAFLRAGRTNVGEVANLVGYGSEVSFTRAFKARFGATPSTFRARASPDG